MTIDDHQVRIEMLSGRVLFLLRTGGPFPGSIIINRPLDSGKQKRLKNANQLIKDERIRGNVFQEFFENCH